MNDVRILVAVSAAALAAVAALTGPVPTPAAHVLAGGKPMPVAATDGGSPTPARTTSGAR